MKKTHPRGSTAPHLPGGKRYKSYTLLEHSTPIVWSGSFIGALIYTGVLATAVVWVLWLYLLNSLSAGAASMGTLATPVVGVLAAWIQLSERPGVAESIGMLLILIALFLISLQSLQQRR